jgi:Dual specificity phosphatase, catalytic domain
MLFWIYRVKKKKKNGGRAAKRAFCIFGVRMSKARGANPGRSRSAANKKGESRAKMSAVTELAPVEASISTEEADVARVRKNIHNMVWNSVEEIARSVIEAAKNGELAPAKYLFEVVGMYPATEESRGKPKEDSPAYLLLKRLGLPTEPVVGDKDSPQSARLATERVASRAPALAVSPRLETRRQKFPERFPANELREDVGKTRPDRKVKRRRVGMDITWVTDRIGVGGGIWNAENMAAVSRAGITHIIDMQIEFDDTPLASAHGIEVCWNPVDDDFEAKPAEVFARGVKFALTALEEDGTKLFVHCAAGVHRAPMMTLALLGVMGWSVEDAMDLIGGRRPAADFAEVYVRSVEGFLNGRG